MTTRLTTAEARALGLLDDDAPIKAAKVRVRATAKGPYHTVCTTCAEEFHTIAAEDRHLNASGHHNYRLVLGY